MSAAALLAAATALLALAALHQALAGGAGIGRPILDRLDRRAAAAGLELGLAGRLARAGLHGRITPPVVLLAKLGSALIGGLLALAAAPAAPGRLVIVVGLALPAAFFFAPDALLERIARKRRAELLASLPDALDLISTSAALGRGTAAGFEVVVSASDGPLAQELSTSLAELECGVSQPAALRSLKQRVPGPQVAGLVAAFERSRRFGSPLAEQLRRQAASLRRDQRRLVEERAARAAPKIQLVVALVLVPSVLLMIVAALAANADRLLGGV